MSHLATLPPHELGPAIARFARSHRYLCAVETLSKVHIYASSTAQVDARIEALTDHPSALVVGEYEFLPKEAVSALKAALPQDPIASALRSLGKQDDPA